MSVEPRQLVEVRAMRARDVPAVLEIEQLSYGYPWSERIFRDCPDRLRLPTVRLSKDYSPENCFDRWYICKDRWLQKCLL